MLMTKPFRQASGGAVDIGDLTVLVILGREHRVVMDGILARVGPCPPGGALGV